MTPRNSIALSFPKGQALKEFLNLGQDSHLEDLFESSLTEPLNNFLTRPRKNIRNQIVQLGFSLASKVTPTTLSAQELESICNACCAVLEIFHAGSLVVDDIQDSSEFRRGLPTLHRIYGVPLALNAGNWLYFLPFKMIEEMPLPASQRSCLIRECNDTLLRAHYGQALDLGVPVDTLAQERVAEVSRASIELKSGVLTGLAFKMGALALGAAPEVVCKFDSFGRRFGIALQMMDDIGCLSSSRNPSKKGEDLKLKRLGHIFGSAAELLPSAEYEALKSLLSSSHENLEEIFLLLEKFHIPKTAKAKAEDYLSSALKDLCEQFELSDDENLFLQSIQTHLVNTYE